jgi:flagellar biosynthetic protein FlhB
MSGEDMDRTEQATPYKLSKAREKGQVAKSADFVSVVVLVTALVCLYAQGARLLERHFMFDRVLLAKAGSITLNEQSFWQMATAMSLHLVQLLGPVFVAIVLAALIGNLVQTGPVLAWSQVHIDWSRLDPVQGAKKIFSMRKVFEGLKAFIKLALLAMVAWLALRASVASFFSLGSLPPALTLKATITYLAEIGFKMGLLLALIAFADMFFTKREFAKRMRMSRRDIKDEIKHRDGDPRIRSRLRQLRQEMLKRSASTRNTAKADVLIVNPTHFAVALKYEHGQMESPLVLAKGSGAFAAAMRSIAARHEIPVVQNVTLARKLYRELEVEQHVPPSLYGDVARIIVWVFAMRKARASQTSAMGAA